MQSIAQLQLRADDSPNSIEIQQALAEAYINEGRWEEAAKTYRGLATLYPDTASLFLNRIRLGAAALMLFAALTLAAVLIQPALETATLPQALASPNYRAAQILSMLALALYSTSAISIYKLLSYTRDHHPAFWGMVFSVIGVGLSMPELGIKTFVYPILGEMLLSGKSDALNVFSSLNENPLLDGGAYLIVTSLVIFAGVIWRNKGLSLPAIAIFLIGWVGLTATREFIVFDILIAVGGCWLGMSLWKQSSIQFDPNMDRASRS
jgi:tetratricopeptide (TPR) repeat protein